MYQRFSRPDRYIARCGHLDAVVNAHTIGGAPPFTRGLRVAFVADTHVLHRTTQAKLDALVGRIADVRPQLLLLGGDYSDRAGDCIRFFEALERFSPPLGCFGVMGNNDAEAWKDDVEGLDKVMARSGCTLLVNRSVDIPFNGGVMRIGGLDEYRYGHPRCDALWLGRDPEPCYRILLSHYPVMPDEKPDLMLCGHTHGGQFNLLGLTPYAIGFERFCKPRRASIAIAGLHDVGGMKLLVSKGIGASRIQLRVGVRPEIDLLVF